ncbi:uncharacterized protein KY384_003166 [Bacidia gigantensis]|uniref:uncharacterized protein n=1 Tax=Bacidia gigantensis TaxID=2732470 RepID=UPI001D056D32|nr:uncharacterized protein KY384_003166 [Bacidia gigantensis]KAG8531537.1 hypothetical protein KY384_003166 [Bacidia gigantensis]
MTSEDRPNSSLTQRKKPADTDLLPREKLPQDLQNLVDDDESLLDQIYDGTASQTTDSSVRYAAYASRLRTVLLSAHRYVAYTSDIGESFRPLAHPWLIKSAYGISWAYLIGDVSHEGYKAYLRNQRILHPGSPGAAARGANDARDATSAILAAQAVPAIEDWKAVVAQRAVFQSVASMGLPAFTIHSIVRYSGRALKGAKNNTIRTWGPIGLGLAAVPFLPYLFDQPVEEATEWMFHKAFETIGGPDAVGHKSATGRVTEPVEETNRGAKKEKEL